MPRSAITASGEAAVAEAVAAATAALIERNIALEPEQVSTIALTQAVPVGPACPVPAPERSAPEKTPTSIESTSHEAPAAAAQTAWTAFAEAQSALARGFEKAAIEMTGISRSGAAATADAAVALLGARTFAEALEINAALARRGLDTMFEASARLSEIGAKAVADASHPLCRAMEGDGAGSARAEGGRRPGARPSRLYRPELRVRSRPCQSNRRRRLPRTPNLSPSCCEAATGGRWRAR